jgi:hypothetical protein
VQKCSENPCKTNILGSVHYLWGFFLGGGSEIIWGGGFSSGNVLTSLKYIIIENENFELLLLNGYKFTGAFALLLTSKINTF